jgi:putative membrane protein
VVVLADRGIDPALGPGASFEDVVELVLAAIRRGALAEGIVAAVQRCGEILARPLPARPDLADEIPQTLFIED